MSNPWTGRDAFAFIWVLLAFPIVIVLDVAAVMIAIWAVGYFTDPLTNKQWWVVVGGYLVLSMAHGLFKQTVRECRREIDKLEAKKQEATL